VALLPWVGRGPTKVFRLPDIKDAAMRLQMPLSVVGDNLLFMAEDKTVGRINLRTGAIAAHEFDDAKKEISLYPIPDGVLYAEEQDQRGAVWGRLDPNTFGRTPIMTITNDLAEKTFIAYDAQGKTVAVVEKTEDAERLVVLREGKLIFSRALGPKGQKQVFGSAGFSPKGDMVWATFGRDKDTNTVSYGLMEIPLSDAAIRETILIPSAPTADDAAGFYFQGNISHDGKTFAVASTFLACTKKEFKPEDCALFLVDLNDPNRKVTRIPIAMPANRPDFK
jgi:hypothetical protein